MQPHGWRAEMRRFALISKRRTMASALISLMGVAAVAAQSADVVGQAFADHCFSPYLTEQKAQDTLKPSGARVDFYDLRPFSSAAPSPVTGRAATPGTDRRCEVAFDGTALQNARDWIIIGLTQERLLDRQIDVPAEFPLSPHTTHAAAVQLNPNRIAVTQIGIRPGPNGVETYLSVERLTPLNEEDS